MIHALDNGKYFPEITHCQWLIGIFFYKLEISKKWKKFRKIDKRFWLSMKFKLIGYFPAFFTRVTYRQSTTVPSVSESKIQLHPCGHISADTMTCGQNDKFADSHKTVRTPLYDPIFLFFIIITWALKLKFLLEFFFLELRFFERWWIEKNFRSLALEPQGISNTHPI